MRVWCEAGGRAADFWLATPAEFNAFIGGYAVASVRRHNLAMTTAFMAARWHREERMTPLRELLADAENPTAGGGEERATATTTDEIRVAMEAWAQVLDGKIKVELEPPPRPKGTPRRRGGKGSRASAGQ